jgi:hypothetical protein
MPASAVTTKRLAKIESEAAIDCGDDGPGGLTDRPDFQIGDRRLRPARENWPFSTRSSSANLSSNRNVDIVGVVRLEHLPAVPFPARPRNKPTAGYRA